MRKTPLILSRLTLALLPAMHAMAADVPWPELSPPAADCSRLDADTIDGAGDALIRARGAVHVSEPSRDLHAEYVSYLRDPEHILAKGKVLFTETGLKLTAEDLDYLPDTHVGHAQHITYVTNPALSTRQKSYGSAESVQFAGPQHYEMFGARYSTCGSSKPAWYISSEHIDLDYKRNVGQAYNAQIHFLDTTIGWVPWVDFPLDSNRKSGFLPPTIASTSSGGIDLSLPYYWDIAPNLDVTFNPREMERRGFMAGVQTRYLQDRGSGELDLEWLSNDQLARQDRSLFSLNSTYRFAPRVTGGVNVEHVSDSQYFVDFGDQLAAATQVDIPREGWLAYQHNDWKALFQIQHFQVLQNSDTNTLVSSAAGVTPLSNMPYWRSPQFAVSGRELVRGLDFNFSGEWVDFRHPQLPDGQRLNLYPSLAWPLTTPYAEFTPKIGLMYTHYSLEANSADDLCTPAQPCGLGISGSTTPLGQLPVPGADSIQRALPIASLNSRLTLERDLSLNGRPYVQTLEPQIYYVYIPYRNQQAIPLFDTADTVFSFAQMFNENRYSGIDRVNDVNQVTVALTSKFLESATGDEHFRIGLGQRYSLTEQKVQLTNGSPPLSTGASDILGLLSVQPSHRIKFETTVDYSETLRQWQRAHTNVNFTPEAGKSLNLGYYFETGQLRQIDLSGEWALARRWSGFARELYSERDHTQLESLAGVQYNAGCWRLSVVFQRYVVSQGVDTTHPIIYLELGGFNNGVGSNPLKILQNSIPGYSAAGSDGQQP